MKVRLNFKFNENTDLKATLNKLLDIEKESGGNIEIEIDISENLNPGCQDVPIAKALKIDGEKEDVNQETTLENEDDFIEVTMRGGGVELKERMKKSEWYKKLL